MSKSLIIGTRGSRLALIQAEIVASMLKGAGETVEIKAIATSGDKSTKPLADEGGKGLFVKEIEEALLAREVDVAVHSMKDVPGVTAKGLLIVAIPARADPRDCFLSEKFAKLGDLPKGARVGTSSPRRQSQLHGMRPDLELLPLRGNVDTRIRKLREGEYDAIILAAAGLTRLGMQNAIREYIPVDKMIPSVGQGALAIQVRVSDPSPLVGEGGGEGDGQLAQKIRRICNDNETEIAVNAERSFLQTIGGDCHTALAAHATLNGDRLHLTGYLRGNADRLEGPVNRAEELGKKLADRLSIG